MYLLLLRFSCSKSTNTSSNLSINFVHCLVIICLPSKQLKSQLKCRSCNEFIFGADFRKLWIYEMLRKKMFQVTQTQAQVSSVHIVIGPIKEKATLSDWILEHIVIGPRGKSPKILQENSKSLKLNRIEITTTKSRVLLSRGRNRDLLILLQIDLTTILICNSFTFTFVCQHSTPPRVIKSSKQYFPSATDDQYEEENGPHLRCHSMQF